MENPKIRAEVIEANEFPDLVRRYAIRGVPKTVINDRVQFEGAVPEKLMLQFLGRALSKPTELSDDGELDEESEASRTAL